jgi:hypothetical protein
MVTRCGGDDGHDYVAYTSSDSMEQSPSWYANSLPWATTGNRDSFDPSSPI